MVVMVKGLLINLTTVVYVEAIANSDDAHNASQKGHQFCVKFSFTNGDFRRVKTSGEKENSALIEWASKLLIGCENGLSKNANGVYEFK